MVLEVGTDFKAKRPKTRSACLRKEWKAKKKKMIKSNTMFLSKAYFCLGVIYNTDKYIKINHTIALISHIK